MTTTQDITQTEAHINVCDRIADFVDIEPYGIESYALQAARHCQLNPELYNPRQQQLADMIYRVFTTEGWIGSNDIRFEYLTSRACELLGPTYCRYF
jgi:hypothetical protein